MKLKEKCQCDLCDCGRHRCELHGLKIPKYQPIPADPKNFTTSYQEQYKPCSKVAKPKPFVPVKAQKIEKLPFYGSTEAGTEFHAKQIPPRFRKEKEKYEKPEGNMDMITTKSADYTVKTFENVKSYKPNVASGRPKELPQFEGETTTSSFYKVYRDVARQPMYGEHPTNLRCNTEKFEDLTTTRDSYPAYRVEARTMPIIPTETNHTTGQQFYGQTTTSEFYKGLAGDPPQPTSHIIPSYKLPTGEMYTETTTQAHYKPVQGGVSPRPKPIIPQTIRQPPAQFHGKTTNMDTYPVHSITKRPLPAEKKQYVPPTEKMDGISNNREFYKAHSVQRKVHKLSPIERKSSAPLPKFEDKTTHRDEFRRWKIEKQVQVYGEPPRLLKPSSCKMETRTMQKRDFVYDKDKVERAQAIIPQVKVIRSDQPISTLTSYRLQYKGLQNKCRLADLLVKQQQQA